MEILLIWFSSLDLELELTERKARPGTSLGASG